MLIGQHYHFYYFDTTHSLFSYYSSVNYYTVYAYTVPYYKQIKTMTLGQNTWTDNMSKTYKTIIKH